MIPIQPYTCKIEDAAGAAVVATGFTINGQLSNGALLRARPVFYTAAGVVIPNGAVPLRTAAGQTPQQLQAAESTEIALACSANSALSIDQAAKGVIAATRGVVLI